jgi:regulator of cell morphogenesis and NO signaling
MNLTMTVGDLAAGSLGAVRVFEKYGIDYCCGGKRPLQDACREKGLDPGVVLGEVTAATGGSAVKDWNTASLRELIRHIVSTHHEYLRRDLPLLTQRMSKALSVHGPQDASLAQLSDIFESLRDELLSHMYKEEAILFPVIGRYEAAVEEGASLTPPPFGTVGNPIRLMEHEHDSAGSALSQMREITGGYAPPAHACMTYRALLQGLAELETDLHQHIHLENNILFPRAAQLETTHGSWGY